MPIRLVYGSAALLVIALAPLPYGYYMFLRIAACGVFGAAAWVTYQRKNRFLPWLYGALAILFNPILIVSFPREIWAVVDLAAAVLLLSTRRAISDSQA